MFCKSCGNEVNEGAAFCPKCGAKIEIPADMRAEMAGNTNKSAISDNAKYDSDSGNKKGKGKKKGIIITIVCAVALIAIVAVVGILYNMRNSTSEYRYDDAYFIVNLNIPSSYTLKNNPTVDNGYSSCFDVGNGGFFAIEYSLAYDVNDLYDSDEISTKISYVLQHIGVLDAYSYISEDEVEHEEHSPIAGRPAEKAYWLNDNGQKMPFWMVYCEYPDHGGTAATLDGGPDWQGEVLVLCASDSSYEKDVEKILQSMTISEK